MFTYPRYARPVKFAPITINNIMLVIVYFIQHRIDPCLDVM